MDIRNVPLSVYGSYMALAYYKEDKCNFRGVSDEGLYLKSLRGKSRSTPAVCKVIPLIDGKEVEFDYKADFFHIELNFEIGSIKICFDGDSRILFKVEGEKAGLRLDFMPASEYEYNFTLGTKEKPYHIINSYKTLTKYIVQSRDGKVELHQENSNTMLGSISSYIDVEPISGQCFTCVIEEIPTHMIKPTEKIYSYEVSKEETKNKFEAFHEAFPKVLSEYEEAYRDAIYVDWSCTVKKFGLLKRDGMYMSNNLFQGIWSWDHCFNALALANVHDELAWDQMMVLFDHQDESGQIPGSVSDSTVRWNFAKPPIHGLFFQEIMNKMEVTRIQLIEAFSCIEKQINFWLNFKDFDQDGICEYHHGNDSGYDNSTVFMEDFVVESPDLSAFLIKGMETLSIIAQKLGRDMEEKLWSDRADNLTKLTLEKFIRGDKIITYSGIEKNVLESQSILPYTLVILGKRLPEELKENIVNTLKNDFTTEYGLATEAVKSPYYNPNGYWRGPIWGPTMTLFIDGLKECGELEFAKELTEKFCKLVKKSGCAENFNAVTGDGLCDKAYTWTASSFIYLCQSL